MTTRDRPWRRLLTLAAVLLAFSSCRAAEQEAAAPPVVEHRGETLPATPRQTAQGHVVVRSVALNKYISDLDGQWQGIRVASDGNCYFGSSTHSARRGGTFWRYDPRTRRLTLLAEDVTLLCGEDPTKTPPQGKLHSDFVEADGRIYFATHLANYWPEAEAAYTGAHVLSYDLASGRFHDYGVVRPGFSIYSGIGVDAARRRAYVFTTSFDRPVAEKEGAHLHRVDLDTGAKHDLGVVKPKGQHACLWMYVDARGDCWFTVWHDNGALQVARADTGKIERYENALPPIINAAGERASDGVQNDRYWGWAQPLPGGERCLFTMVGGDALWVFDPSKDVKDAFQMLHRIGPTTLGMGLGGDRVYFARHLGGRPGPREVRLCSVSLDPAADPAVVDYGAIVDQDGRTPQRIESLAADAEGRVFMVGDWNLLEGEKGTTRHARTPDGQNVYNELRRGQFFAVVELAR